MLQSEIIGVALIQGKKISKTDLAYLRRYHCSEKPNKITEQELLSLPVHTLTQGQKAWRSWILKKNKMNQSIES